MIVDPVRTWRQGRVSSGRRRPIAKGIAAGLSIIVMAVVLSACAATPTLFTATANANGTITLSWADVSSDGYLCPNFDGYAVYISTTPGGEDTTGPPVGATLVHGQSVSPTKQDLNESGFPTGSYSLVVAGLQPGTTYYFVVLTVGTLADDTTTCIASQSAEMSASTVAQASGGVLVTLSWSSTADLDLHVVEPDGTEIYYGNTTSADGGTYGADANGGCSNTTTSPEETVTWNETPQSGTYTIKAVYYEACQGTGGTGPQSFTINVYRGGPIYHTNGVVNSPGEEQDYTVNL